MIPGRREPLGRLLPLLGIGAEEEILPELAVVVARLDPLPHPRVNDLGVRVLLRSGHEDPRGLLRLAAQSERVLQERRAGPRVLVGEKVEMEHPREVGLGRDGRPAVRTSRRARPPLLPGSRRWDHHR